MPFLRLASIESMPVATRVATGIDSMLANLKNGIGAMPPMGTCTDCSDEELTAGIEYMVANSQ